MKENDPANFDRELCPVMKAVNLIGDKWILMILRECFLGFKKFDDFQENLDISRSVLASRLKKMVSLDLLYRKQYRDENERPRSEYRLTSKGWDFIKAVIALMEWGNEHLVEAEEDTLRIFARDTHEEVSLKLEDSEGRKVDWYNLELKINQKHG